MSSRPAANGEKSRAQEGTELKSSNNRDAKTSSNELEMQQARSREKGPRKGITKAKTHNAGGAKSNQDEIADTLTTCRKIKSSASPAQE